MSQPGSFEPFDWYAIVRCLMHGESHFRPWEILRLTEPEIIAELDADLRNRRPPSYGTPLNSDREVIDYLQRQRAMTPRERLQQAMED